MNNDVIYNEVHTALYIPRDYSSELGQLTGPLVTPFHVALRFITR